MSKSRLSHKLALCDLIEQLDDKACINVIRSIHTELGCDNLNMLLRKIILRCTSKTTTDSLIKIENVIKDIVSTVNDSANNDQYINIKGNFDDDKASKYINSKKSKKIQKNNTLLRLPIDLISTTSLHLNEKDIFSFEKCCRLFYHIINNSSYVNQSNTFKTFDLTKEQLDKMAQAQYNFYKYSKATTLIVRDFSGGYPTVEEFEAQFEKAKTVANYDKWFPTMLKTVKLFEIESNPCSKFFNQLPLDIMFDAAKSSLETIRFNCGYTNNIVAVQFATEYKNLKEKFEAQGKKIKVLNCVQQYRGGLFPSDLFCVESKHICVCSIIDWKSWDYVRDSNSSLTAMTFQGDCSFRGMKDSDTRTMKAKEYLQIQTLRLIDFYHSNSNQYMLLTNEKVIEILNLHHSVRNMTVGVTLYSNDFPYPGSWKKILSNLLTKKYYFNLLNINILLRMYIRVNEYSLSGLQTLVDWMFGILRENKNVLKYQFKQLRIGIQSSGFFHNPLIERCYVIEFNQDAKTNDIDKVLDDYKAKCDVSLKQSISDYLSSYKEYQEMKHQWVD